MMLGLWTSIALIAGSLLMLAVTDRQLLCRN
jgi:hypothetical protein